MNFSENLNRLLKEKNLSLKWVSERTGIARTTLSEWSAGRKPTLCLELLKLAEVLGVTLEYLITGKNPEEDVAKRLLGEVAESFVEIHSGTYRIKVEKRVR